MLDSCAGFTRMRGNRSRNRCQGEVKPGARLGAPRMKTATVLLGLALAFTFLAVAPPAQAACAQTLPNPVVHAQACTDGSCHVDVLQGTVEEDCP